MVTESKKKEELAASKESVSEAYEKLLEANKHFRLAAEAAGVELKDDVTDQLVKNRKNVEDLGQPANDYIKEKPFTSLCFAVAAGFVLAHLTSKK